jgi:transcriptional regulator with AAA-type ATPase domain
LLLGEGLGWEEKIDLPLSDWLRKPFGVESLREKVRVLLLERDWVEESGGGRVILSVEERVRSWIHSLRVGGEVRERVMRVVGSSLPVVIYGEEGTGRSEVAKAVHWMGRWKGRPFLRFYCRDLTVAGFMERVSFWLQGRGGGGRVSWTLYLEEVDSLGWDLQGVLLDLLHDQRVGWGLLEGVGLEVRVIASSRFSLGRAVSAGRFRGDLYQVLEVLSVVLKPLRERREEIPGMVSEVLGEREDLRRKRFSLEALQVLQQYYWPGNLRELESVVLRSAALKEGEWVLPEDLVFSFSGGEAWGGLGEGRRVGDGVMELSASSEEEVGSLFDATLWILAHEMKNPLVAISTFAYLLPEKYEDAEFREQFSRLVGMDVKRINGLLEKLLEYTQLSVPRLVGNDLNLMLEGVLKQKEKELFQRGMEWVTELGEGLPAVLFDEVQLGFVLRSILENVFSKVGEKRSLRLKTGLVERRGREGRPGFVELQVWYEGQEEILRGQHREEGREAEWGYENWSLALALARKVMVRNRGEMQVSLGERSGMAIRLRFPVAGSAERRAVRESHA